MKLYLPIAMCMLLSGCQFGKDGEEFPYSFHTGCVDFYMTKPTQEQAMVWNEQLASRMFEELTGNNWCELVSQIPVYISDTYQWDCADKQCVGQYHYFKGIKLNRYMDGFLHESLHAYEISRWVFDTGNHFRWDELGYNKAHEAYYDQRVSPERPFEDQVVDGHKVHTLEVPNQ